MAMTARWIIERINGSLLALRNSGFLILASHKSAISAMGHRADLPTTKGGDEVKLIIDGNGVRVKLEVNFIFRGNVAARGTATAHLHRARRLHNRYHPTRP